jgi:hypothetical protein
MARVALPGLTRAVRAAFSVPSKLFGRRALLTALLAIALVAPAASAATDEKSLCAQTAEITRELADTIRQVLETNEWAVKERAAGTQEGDRGSHKAELTVGARQLKR